MRNHYVQRQYLRGFCDPVTPDIIVCYDKQSDRVLRINTRHVAVENDFYDDPTERFLETQIESPANPVLDKIRKLQTITLIEKRTLAIYIAAQYLRGTKGKELAAAHTPIVLRELFDQAKAQLNGVQANDEATAQLVETRLQEALDLHRKWESEKARELWLGTIPMSPDGQLKDVIGQMTWRFAVCEDEPSFLTSDNPMYFPADIGIVRARSEITFPISAHVALWATWRSDIMDGYVPIGKRAVAAINRRTVFAAHRYVFFTREEKWVSHLVKRKTHALGRIG